MTTPATVQSVRARARSDAVAARPRSGTARITFLDEDHVLRMARQLLTARTAAEWATVVDFFAPDAVDRSRLEPLTAGLTAADGVAVEQATTDLEQSAAGSTILVFRRGTVTRSLLKKCPQLRLVQRLGQRSDGIDVCAAHELGVDVSCIPRRSLASTAEHTLLLILALTRRLRAADQAVRAGRSHPSATQGADGVAYNWAGLTDVTGLAGRTLGIVGLGEVGALVATRARAFDMRVLYCNRTRLSADTEAAFGAEHRPLRQLLAEADVVTLHVPSQASNERLIDRAAIDAMRPGAVLVNTSRGRLVDEDALYAALVDGRLAGAGLDVHRHEPRPADDRFCALGNVILTPHIGGGSRLDVLHEVQQMFDNMRQVLAGGRPLYGYVAGAS